MILTGTEAGRGRPLVLLHGLFGSASNWGTVQRALAQPGMHGEAPRRVLALDLRNHGASPHHADMRYDTMAGDVLDTLRARDALPASVLGHSMGGKVAMRLALRHADAVGCLVVADMAPVPYASAFQPFIDAMRAVRLHPSLTRAEADATLAPAVANPGTRAFLLQNLRLGPHPAWRLGLEHVAAALPGISGWDDPPPGAQYPGPTLFLSGGRSDYVRPEHRPAIRTLFPAARFASLRAAGHWLHAEDPAGFTATVQAFLSAVQA